MKRLALAMILCLVPMIALAQDVKTDYDHGVDFSRYHTFAYHSGKGMGQGRMINNSIVADRIHSAVEEDLASKGLHLSQSNPDLYVSYFLGAKDEQNVTDGFPYGIGRWGWGMWNDVMVTNYTEGTLVLDFIDAHTNKLVWRAYIQKAVNNPQDLGKEKNIDKMVSKAVKKFPPKA